MLARRVASYNHGAVVCDGHLHDNQLFQVNVYKSNSLLMHFFYDLRCNQFNTGHLAFSSQSHLGLTTKELKQRINAA